MCVSMCCPPNPLRVQRVRVACPISVMKSRASGMDWTDRGRRRRRLLESSCRPVSQAPVPPVRPCVRRVIRIKCQRRRRTRTRRLGSTPLPCSIFYSCRCQFIALAWNCFCDGWEGTATSCGPRTKDYGWIYIYRAVGRGLARSTEEMRKGWRWLRVGCLFACWCLWASIYLQICAAQETGSCPECGGSAAGFGF